MLVLGFLLELLPTFVLGEASGLVVVCYLLQGKLGSFHGSGDSRLWSNMTLGKSLTNRKRDLETQRPPLHNYYSVCRRLPSFLACTTLTLPPLCFLCHSLYYVVRGPNIFSHRVCALCGQGLSDNLLLRE